MSILTSKTAFSGTTSKNDLIHLVDVSDNTDDPAGSSFKCTKERFLGYKSYIVLLSQTLTNAPTVSIIQNELSGTPTWARSSSGVYTCTLASEWTAGKTFINFNHSTAARTAGWVVTSTNVITCTVNNATGSPDSSLTEAFLEIRVYL